MRRTLWIALALVGAVLIGWLGWSRLRPYAYHGTPLPGDRPAMDFTLQAVDGPHSLREFRGKWVVLFFGYTHCPDVCPTTLADMKRVMQLLGRKADRVQFIMISVDPERDTPERMAAFVQHFDPRFLGLTGDAQTIAQIAAAYGIYYQKHEGTAATGYLVDHTASLLVIDPQGAQRLLLPPNLTPEEIAADLDHLIR